MRVARFLGLLLLPAALLAGGCAPDVPRANGSAAPVLGSPAPAPGSAAPTTAASATAASATAAPTTKASTTAPPTTKASTTRPATRLGPDGWGALRLGMTFRQASGTGLIGPWDDQGGALCQSAALRNAPAEEGIVIASDLGVVYIGAFGTMRTPQGIGLGSSRAAVLKAYPTWQPIAETGEGADGRGFVRVPGNSAAVYRIVTEKGRVSELTIELRSQNCYE